MHDLMIVSLLPSRLVLSQMSPESRICPILTSVLPSLHLALDFLFGQQVASVLPPHCSMHLLFPQSGYHKIYPCAFLHIEWSTSSHQPCQIHIPSNLTYLGEWSFITFQYCSWKIFSTWSFKVNLAFPSDMPPIFILISCLNWSNLVNTAITGTLYYMLSTEHNLYDNKHYTYHSCPDRWSQRISCWEQVDHSPLECSTWTLFSLHIL